MFSPIFKNKPVSVTKANIEKTVIKINGKNFVPISAVSDKVNKHVVIDGTVYIPVLRKPLHTDA